MRYIIFPVLVLVVLMVGRARSEELDKVLWMTEEFPPFNYIMEGELQGIAVDIVEKLFQRVGAPQTRKSIVSQPWARSYSALQKRPGTALFVVTRTEEREHLFKWVGPLTKAKNVLIGVKKDRGACQINLAACRVGAVRDDAAGQLFLHQNAAYKKKLLLVNSAQTGLKMLSRDRTDLFAYDETVVKWQLDEMGMSFENFEIVAILSENDHYIAFHKDTPETLINRYQQALDDLKAEGR